MYPQRWTSRWSTVRRLTSAPTRITAAYRACDAPPAFRSRRSHASMVGAPAQETERLVVRRTRAPSTSTRTTGTAGPAARGAGPRHAVWVGTASRVPRASEPADPLLNRVAPSTSTLDRTVGHAVTNVPTTSAASITPASGAPTPRRSAPLTRAPTSRATRRTVGLAVDGAQLTRSAYPVAAAVSPAKTRAIGAATPIHRCASPCSQTR